MNRDIIKSMAIAVLLVAISTASLFATDTGKVITNQCRQNLKMLNEITAKFVSETTDSLPPWARYEVVKSSLMSYDYLPKDPEAPTPDCKYFLISNSRDDFQWYCGLHGVLEGEKTITFQYHEHRIMAKTTERYMSNKRYKDHTSDLLRWTEYTPTPVERLKFQYNMNPLSTILLLSGIVLLILFIYRSL